METLTSPETCVRSIPAKVRFELHAPDDVVLRTTKVVFSSNDFGEVWKEGLRLKACCSNGWGIYDNEQNDFLSEFIPWGNYKTYLGKLINNN